MIREAWQEEMKAHIERLKPQIKKALANRIREEGGSFVNTVADKIVEGIGEGFYVNIRLKVEDEE